MTSSMFLTVSHLFNMYSLAIVFCTLLWQINMPMVFTFIIRLSRAAFLWDDLDPDQWSKICLDHDASEERVNPSPEWIRRFLCCTMIQTDLGSLIRIWITPKERSLTDLKTPLNGIKNATVHRGSILQVEWLIKSAFHCMVIFFQLSTPTKVPWA